MVRAAAVSLMACAALAGWTCAVRADDVADFYRSKTVDLIVASEAGGGYDVYARLVARFMERHMPGQPRFVAKQMVGAGGIIAGNYLSNVAKRDGTAIAQVQNTVPFQQLFAPEGVRFNATEIGYIGSANSEVSLSFVWHTSPIQNFRDVQQRETMMAGVTGSISSQHARALAEFAGAKIRLITGYIGASQSLLAVERGEVEGYPAIFWSTLKTTRESWLEQKKIRLLTQMALKKHPELPEIPLIFDFITNEAARRTAELLLAPQVGGRPFIAPPGIPSERLTALRKAFEASLADPELLAEAAKRKLEIQLTTGAELAATIAKAYASDAATVERVRAIYAGK